MRKSVEQEQARRVQRATGGSYQACLQELRRRVAARWASYDGSFQRFLEAEADDLIAGWGAK